MIRVVAAVGGEIVGDRQALLPGREVAPVEGVGIVGVSSLAAGPLTLVPELKAALGAQGRDDIMIVVGGVVPPQDYDALKAAGAEAIFPPGTVIADAAEELLRKLNARLGYGRAAAE